MSKFKQSLAISSAAALVAAGLGVSAPAYAAGEVTLAPTSGTNLSVFNTDEFSLSTTVLTQVVSAGTVSYAITAPEGGKFYVKVGSVANNTATDATDAVTFSAKDALGNNIDLLSGNDAVNVSLNLFVDGATPGFTGHTDGDEVFGEFYVDFTALGARTLYLSDFAGAINYDTISISPYEGTVTAESNTPAGGIDVRAAGENIGGNGDERDYGDGAFSVSVQAWIDLDSDIDDVEANYASSVQTINWVDPKGVAAIPRVEQYKSGSTLYLNSDTNSNQNLGASLQFAATGINLDQIDITKWGYQITDGGGTEIKSRAAFASEGAIRAGLLEQDDSSRYYFVAPVGANLDKTKTYKVVVDHSGATTVDFGSVAYALPTSTEEYHIEATVDQTTTNALQSSDTDNDVELRPGTSTFKWTAQIKTDDSTVAKTASVPVLAVVEASSLYVNGTISVSGTTETITSKSGYVLVNGFTDADGKWAISVTSSSALKDVAYTVRFYVVDSSSDDSQAGWVTLSEAAGGGENAVYTATYTSATASTLTADNSVLSGSNVTVTFTAKDNYGVATAVNGTKALSVELKSANGTSYDKDVAVAADGTASFTFANYLTAGQSDVLTATLYTGTSSSPTNVTTAIITLYNAPAVSALQVPASASGVITYDDFITGKATTAAPAPNDGTMTITGTAVDANGAGIPGAAVLVESAGLQFVQNGGSVYAKDKITVVANAAGVFVVDVWAQKTNSTGFKINFTSGGKTASTTVKTYLPTGLDGNNLKFELAMPANVVKNVTYAVTAKLTDKWGNPVATRTNNALSIQGFGSVQINSSDTATTRQFGRDGTVVVFLRSVKDIAGPGSVEATLAINSQYSSAAAGNATNLTVTEITTDVTTTAWNETLFKNSISANVEVLESAAGVAKVNVGSFNGKLVVYANGYNGKRISWKVGGRWGSALATSNTARFDRPTPRRGVDVVVEIYVDGKLELTKTVRTR
jgi:hypothetical protein